MAMIKDPMLRGCYALCKLSCANRLSMRMAKATRACYELVGVDKLEEWNEKHIQLM